MPTPLFDHYLAETTARAALIIRRGELWAQAGEITTGAAQQLSADLWGFYEQQPKPAPTQGAILRFVRLETEPQPARLYATHFASHYLLALIFTAATPLSQMRLQTARLEQFLLRGDRSEPALRADSPPPESTLPKAEWVETTRAWRKEIDGEPAPTSAEKIALQQSLNGGAESAQFDPDLDLTPAWEHQVSLEISPAQDFPSEETALASLIQEGAAHNLEPVATTVYNLVYTCLLVPRFPHRYLTGDLADQLSRWFLQISLAFGWRLESLTVHSHYVHWIVRTSPSTAPATLLRVFRQQTSQRIFAQFADLKEENPAGDFWAPGYLILSGAHLASTQLLREFLKRTRDRQGI